MTPGTDFVLAHAVTRTSGISVLLRHYSSAVCEGKQGHAPRVVPQQNGTWRLQSFNSLRAARSRIKHAISAVAVADQEPLHPEATASPTAQQIFDLHHVPRMSPSLLLYFPVGKLPFQAFPAANTAFGCQQHTEHFLRAAGVLLASIRMALWVTLLAADRPWLTDNNTSIAGMPTFPVLLFLTVRTVRQAYNCSRNVGLYVMYVRLHTH